MKYLATFLMLFSFNTANAFEIEKDKQLHLGVSMAISSIVWMAHRAENEPKFKSYYRAVFFTIAVGAMKELSDDKFDNKDMLYNSIGAVSAPLLLWWF